MVYAFLKELRANTNEKDFKEILKMTTDDILFNRVNFGKCTSPKEFIAVCSACYLAYVREVCNENNNIVS
ncbi:MAG: hypothetical protein ACRC7N_21400 [Clostridium sp.]